jgi:hypothetical protein
MSDDRTPESRSILEDLRDIPLDHWTKNETERGLIYRPPSTELVLYAALREGIDPHHGFDGSDWLGYSCMEVARAYCNLERWGMIGEVRPRQPTGLTPLAGFVFPSPIVLEELWDLTDDVWYGVTCQPEVQQDEDWWPKVPGVTTPAADPEVWL